MSEYTWTDNPTQSGIATCDTDVLNDDLMHLKYNNSDRFIGEIIQSTLPLTGAGVHLLDGALLQYGSYKDFIDYIAEIYNSGSYTNLFTTEADWQTSVNTYGVCGKFVYTPNSTETYYAWYSSEDESWYYTASATPSANDHYYHIYEGGELIDDGIVSSYSGTQITIVNYLGHTQTAERDSTKDTTLSATVRLPKIKGFTEATITPSSLGDLVEAGLPNISGTANLVGSGSTGLYMDTTGAFSAATGTATNNRQLSYSSGGTPKSLIEFSATSSNSIYGNSNTVQPQSIKVLYYIVIATSVRTDIEINIDNIATDLNGKAGTDLVNINDVGTSNGASWAMPSDTYKDLTLGATGATYTAPANGWFCICKVSSASGQSLSLENSTKKIGQASYSSATNQYVKCFLPVSKGDEIACYYGMGGATQWFVFIYAVGSESEAS